MRAPYSGFCSLFVQSSILISLASCGEVESTPDATESGPVDASIPAIDATQRVCGDGVQDLGEECDDGNTFSTDGCSAVCLDETDACIPTLLSASFAIQSPGRLLVDEGTLYVAPRTGASNGRVLILDVGNVGEQGGISQLGFFQHNSANYPSARIINMAKRGNLLWLAGADPGITSVDVADPSSPQQADLDLNPGTDGHLALFGPDHLIVSRSVAERPVSIDISQGTIATTTPLGNPGDVYYNVGASETHAFATQLANQIHVFADPASSDTVGLYQHPTNWNSGSAITRIAAQDNVLVVAIASSPAAGVLLLDTTNISVPTLQATLLERPSDVFLRGDFLYIPIKSGIRVYDISDLANPVAAASITSFTLRADSVTGDDNFLYVAGESGIRVVSDLPGMCEPRCGNNVVEWPERCDDGNHSTGDGCDAECLVE